MRPLCYIRSMRIRSRGLALVASLLMVMSVFFMVTVMVANMRVELTATKLDGKAVQDRYKARAACAEVSLLMAESTGVKWESYTSANPYRLDGYDPPVLVWFTKDSRTDGLLHMHAQCEGEFSVRVFHRMAVAEAQIFSALISADGGMRLHSLAMSDGWFRGDLGEVPTDNAFSPWDPIANPPGFVYDAGGALVEFNGGPAKRYVADMRGGLYATLGSSQGFGLYKYAGGQAWTRMPARPALSFSPVTGSLAETGSSYRSGVDGETPVWDVARDGGKIWFAENVAASPAAPSGGSYLQAYDTIDQQWQSVTIPPLSLGGGGAQRFAIKDVAAGEEGQVFVLTEATASLPSRVVRYRDGRWSVLPLPPRHYYLADNVTCVTEDGSLPVESIAVGIDNTLFACGPARPGLSAVSRYTTSWGLGLERDSRGADLASRDFSSTNGYRPMSVDASGRVVLGRQSLKAVGANVVRGSRDNRNYQILPNLMEKAGPGESVWSNIGGGLQGTSTSIFRVTAEY